MKRFHIVLLLWLGLAAASVMARAPVPIVNHEDVPVRSSSQKALTPEAVKAAITEAALFKKWTVSDAEPGRLVATLNSQGKHLAVVEISYSAQAYSLKYKDSLNLKYTREQDGPGLIHPSYNRWVDQLQEAIRFYLGKA